MISYNTLTAGVYEGRRYELMVLLEEAGHVSHDAYADSVGIPTVGVGFNMRDPGVRRQVLIGLGFSGDDANGLNDQYFNQNEQPYVTRIRDIANQDWTNNTPGLQIALNAVMADRAADDLVTTVDENKLSTFQFDSDADIRAVFDRVAEDYENIVDARTPNVPNSEERLALFSLAYNNPALIGPGLQGAIANGDRQDAWFQIRYQSNGGTSASAGIAKRRYYESELFGLYNDPTNVTATEAQDIIAYLNAPFNSSQTHLEYMINYENTYWRNADNAVTDYHLDGTPYQNLFFQDIFKPIASYLIDHYLEGENLDMPGTNYSFDGDVVLGFTGGATYTIIDSKGHDGISGAPDLGDLLIAIDNSVSNILDGGTGNDFLIGANGQDTLRGGDDHDVLIGKGGNDSLDGGSGIDYLAGGAGNDTLNGGEGNDLLEGGIGNDTYIFNGNFGFDEIKDLDGIGNIIINNQTVGEVKLVDGTDTIYRSADGNIDVLRINEGSSTTLLLSQRAGAVGDGGMVVIRDWSEGDLGITLNNEVETSTPPAQTFIGNENSNVVGYTGPFLGGDPIAHMEGGAGDDLVRGLMGDTLLGGIGDDWIIARYQAGRDLLTTHIDGGEGNDIISTVNINGVIHGGAGNDFIRDNWEIDVRLTEGIYHHADGTGIQITRETLWQDFLSYVVRVPDTARPEFYDVFPIARPQWEQFDSVQEGIIYYHRAYEQNINGYIARTSQVYYGDEMPDADHQATFGDAFTGFLYDVTLVPMAGYEAVQDKKGNSYFGDAGYDTIYGRWFADYISGGTEDDRLYGMEGHDVIDGGEHNDSIYGGEGNDTLIGGAGDDIIYGADASPADDKTNLSDNDVIYGGDGNDTLDGFRGDDHLDGGNHDDTLHGGEGSDTLLGDAGSDVLYAGNGSDDDTGDDYLDGGADDDFLYGSAGNDTLLGGEGNDQLVGFEGNNYLDGGEGNDSILGGSQNDTIMGGAGDDELSGGGGDDIIDGGTGKNSIDAGDGNNWIKPGEVAGYLAASSGNDTYVFDSGSAQLRYENGVAVATTIADTGGTNTLVLGGAAYFYDIDTRVSGNDLILRFNDDTEQLIIQNGVNGAITNFTNRLELGEQGNTYDDAFADNTPSGEWLVSTNLNSLLLATLSTSINRTAQYAGETIAGGMRNDRLTAHIGGATLMGGEGNDQLYGGVGDDTYVLRIDDGDDSVNEAGGNNAIVLGEGIAEADVTVRRQYGTDLSVSLSSGDSITVYSMFSSSSGAVRPEYAVQTIRFADGTEWDLNRVQQEALKHTSGNDIIYGFDQANSLTGGSGNDSLYGALQDDQLTGGTGSDYLAGDKGNDTYFYQSGDGSDIIYDREGIDTLVLGEGINPGDVVVEAGIVNYQNSLSNLVLVLPDGSRITINRAFNASTLTLNDSYALEFVQFANGVQWTAQDLLDKVLNPEKPVIEGSDANDTLVGGSGDEILIGGKGDDTLQGNQGDDEYWYQPGDGNDQIIEAGGSDALVFESDINASDIALHRVDTDLHVELSDGAQITIRNMFFTAGGGTNSTNALELIRFANGEEWDLARIQTEILTAGSAGNDVIFGGDANDLIEGFDGADQLSGGNGADTISGGAGDDSLMGNAGLDILIGGKGNDYFNDYDAIYRFDMGDGNDVLTGGGSYQLQMGNGITPADMSVSTEGKDIIFHCSNSDSIRVKDVNGEYRYRLANISLAFADGTVWTNDNWMNLIVVEGGDSADTLYGFNLRNDLINGFADNDVIYGGGGSDTLNGGDGNDTLYGADSSGGMYLYGGQDAGDLLNGGAGDDDLYGEAGNDIYIGAEGNDRLEDTSTTSNDTYQFGTEAGHDRIKDFGGTADRIEFINGVTANDVDVRNTADGITFTLASNTSIQIAQGFEGSIESVLFSDGVEWNNQALRAQALRAGTEANETIFGFSSDDVLSGGQGDDYLVGGLGADTYQFNTGDGDEHIRDFGSDSALDVIQLGSGINEQDLSVLLVDQQWVLSFSSGDSITLVGSVNDNNIEVVRFADGTEWDKQRLLLESQQPQDSVQTITGDSGNNVLIGGSANDIITGADGADILRGGLGSDELRGGDHDDQLFGGTGNDFLYGEEGNDYLYAGRGNDLLNGGSGNDTYHYELGHGADTVVADSGSDVIEFGKGIDQHNVIVRNGTLTIGNSGTDSISLQGDWSNLSLSFYDGTVWNAQDILLESLRATAGDDTITGYMTDDYINGMEGSDVLYGMAGSDTLVSGSGTNYLYGGEGNDLLISSTEPLSYSLHFTQLDGGLGDDTYQIDAGARLTYIAEGIGFGGDGSAGAGGFDVIVLPAAVTETDVLVRVGRFDNDNNRRPLEITLATGEIISVESMFLEERSLYPGFSGQVDSVRSIEALRFPNGIEWDVNRLLLEAMTPTTSDDYLFGFVGNDVMEGLSGNDKLTGGFGNDTYIGGMGDDYIDDVFGSDVYYFSRGDGADSIYDANGIDVIEFGGDIIESDVTLTRQGEKNLVVTLNSGETVTVQSMFNTTSNTTTDRAIEIIRFSNGTEWNLERIMQEVFGPAESALPAMSELPVYAAGLEGAYYGYHQPDNNNVNLLNLNQVREVINNNEPDAGFIGQSIHYMFARTLLGSGTVLQTFLGNDANSLTTDPVDTSDAVLHLTGQVTLDEGNHNFRVQADDGYSIVIDGNVVAEYNGKQGSTRRTHDTFSIAEAGKHDIEIVYWDEGSSHDFRVEISHDGGASYQKLEGAILSHEVDSSVGDNVYDFARDDGAVAISEQGGTDQLNLDSAIATDQLWFERSGDDLLLSIIGTTDAIAVNDWYVDPVHQVETFATSDGAILHSADVDNLVQAMAAFAPPAMGEVSLSQAYRDSLEPIIAANWQ